MSRRALLGLLLACAACAVSAADRSRSVRAEFQRSTPCPSTGRTSGPCHGYQADHHTPLCIGGKDEPANLRWMSVEDHKRKTRSDVRLCRTHP